MTGNEEIGDVWEDIPTWERAAIILAFLFLSIVTVAASLYSGYDFLSENYGQAATLASIASGTGMVILVGVTFWYAYETRRVVRLNIFAEEARRQEEEDERERDVESLRQALHAEIGAVENLNAAKSLDLEVLIKFDRLAPTVVFNQTAGELGKLTEAEVKAVVEYYTNLQYLEYGLQVVRRGGNLNYDDLMEQFETTVDRQDQAIKLLEESL